MPSPKLHLHLPGAEACPTLPVQSLRSKSLCPVQNYKLLLQRSGAHPTLPDQSKKPTSLEESSACALSEVPSHLLAHPTGQESHLPWSGACPTLPVHKPDRSACIQSHGYADNLDYANYSSWLSTVVWESDYRPHSCVDTESVGQGVLHAIAFPLSTSSTPLHL